MKLTTRQKNKLKEHSEHHSPAHMEFMKRRMRAETPLLKLIKKHKRR